MLSQIPSFLTIIALSLLALFGLSKLGFEDDYRAVFESSDQRYASVDELFRDFKSDEGDILVLVEGEELKTKPGLNQLRELVLELSTWEELSSVISIFDARDGPNLEPLFPDEEASDSEFLSAWEAANKLPQIKNSLVNASPAATLVVISYDEPHLPLGTLDNRHKKVRTAADEYLQNTGLSFGLTGFPVMRVEIIKTLQRDQLVFAGIGATLGTAITWMLFKYWVPVLLVTLTAYTGVFWSLGALGLFGESINVINTVLPALILVIAIADAMHLISGFERRVLAGKDRKDALKESFQVVSRACIVTSLTTATAFLSLSLSETIIIRNFGLAAAGSALLCLFSVLLVTPSLLAGALGARYERYLQGKPKERSNFETFGFIPKKPKRVALAALFLTTVLLILSFKLDTSYSHRENLPDTNEAFQTIGKLDEYFEGALPIRILIEWPQDSEEKLLELLSEIENLVELEPKIGTPISILNWGDEKSFHQLVNKIPEKFRKRIIREDIRKTLISGNLKDMPGSEKQSVLDALEQGVQEISSSYSGFRVNLAGVKVISSRRSEQMIRELARSLGVAFPVIFLTIALFTRSLVLGLASIIPNILPLAAVSGGMYLLGEPLRYSSVIVFCICLGIAVDDSVHFLMHYKRKRAQGLAPETACKEALKNVGRVLVITSLILIAGLLSLAFSGLPTIRQFGLLSSASIVLALVADLYILPAILLALERKQGSRKPGA